MGIIEKKLEDIYYLAFPGMVQMLKTELIERFSSIVIKKEYGDLLEVDISNGAEMPVPFWCRVALLEPMMIEFNSIGEAVSSLRQMQRSWAHYPYACFRRGSLIQEKLPYVNLKKKTFPYEIPHSPIGLYTLLDEHTMIASGKTSSPLPCGSLELVEDHENPPSRAYLKIQEALCWAHYYFGVPMPDENSKCFEAGACPGGWTWVLTQLGSEVVAVDRSPLSPSLMDDPLVSFLTHDAFTLKPSELGAFDWVFSDVICYPERLLEWIKLWLDSGLAGNMICTIKMQGSVNWSLVNDFASIPGSKVVHLGYNKHELTFIHCSDICPT